MRLTAYALLVSIMTSTGAARAQSTSSTPPDAVYLKGGGIVRGSLMEYEPNGQARVQLANGEVRTIPADQIERVATGGQSTPPSTPRPPPVATARLHVQAPRAVEVVGRPDDGFEWAPICTGSCDKAVRLDWEYQVRGEGVKPSAPFQLSVSEGQSAVVNVDPASKGWFILGIVGMVGGANIGLIGLYVMAVGALVQDTTFSTDGMPQTTQSTSGAILAVGGIITAVGVAAIVGGAVATFGNWSTKVSQSDRSEARPALPIPMWRTADVRDMPQLPNPIGAPLLTVRF